MHSPGKESGKDGGIAVFLHEYLIFNIRHDLSVNNADIEALCVEKTFSIVNQQGVSMNLRHI